MAEEGVPYGGLGKLFQYHPMEQINRIFDRKDDVLSGLQRSNQYRSLLPNSEKYLRTDAGMRDAAARLSMSVEESPHWFAMNHPLWSEAEGVSHNPATSFMALNPGVDSLGILPEPLVSASQVVSGRAPEVLERGSVAPSGWTTFIKNLRPAMNARGLERLLGNIRPNVMLPPFLDEMVQKGMSQRYPGYGGGGA